MPKKDNHNVISSSYSRAASDFFRVKDIARRRSLFRQSNTSGTPTSSPPFSPIDEYRQQRPSIPPATAASSVFPDLFKLEIATDMSSRSASNPNTATNNPLLILDLSNPSFLDSVISDAGAPLYSINTHKNSTRIFRRDSATTDLQICYIRWPSAASIRDAPLLPNITVQMGKTRPKPAEDFLKFGSLYKYVFFLFLICYRLILIVSS